MVPEGLHCPPDLVYLPKAHTAPINRVSSAVPQTSISLPQAPAQDSPSLPRIFFPQILKQPARTLKLIGPFLQALSKHTLQTPMLTTQYSVSEPLPFLLTHSLSGTAKRTGACPSDAFRVSNQCLVNSSTSKNITECINNDMTKTLTSNR